MGAHDLLGDRILVIVCREQSVKLPKCAERITMEHHDDEVEFAANGCEGISVHMRVLACIRSVPKIHSAPAPADAQPCLVYLLRKQRNEGCTFSC